ncbi:MAG: ATP-binding protein [Thermodesulfobacteriota bacterium]
MQSYRLKIKIILGLAIFIATGMLLIDVVVTMSSQKRLLLVEMDKAKVLATVLADRIGRQKGLSPELFSQLTALSQKARMDLAVADAQGQIQFHSRPEGGASLDLEMVARRAILSRGVEGGTSGRSISLLGMRYDYLLTAAPVRSENGQLLAGVGVALDVAPLYQGLFVSQRLIILYFFLNLVVLTFLAYQRMVKLLIKPLQRLVQRAEEYKDEEDFYFLSGRKGDDVAALSTSLNSMLRRINRDREKLQDMVVALEEANRSLKDAQQEVVRAEKLASVGRLSAGIAHEIGNPVGIVLGYLELLKQESLEPAERLDFINRAIDEISRINTIIRQLLDLARTGVEEHGEVPVHDLLADLCNGLKDQPLLATMAIKLDLGAQNDVVYAVADKLRQVFLNIIMNAADAVQSKDAEHAGELAIVTAIVTAELEPGQKDVPALEISFADNGPGIASENVDTIFDPFFTTKEPGKGTGLGLSVSYMIIENAKGRITAASRPEGGSVFTVLLPLAQAQKNNHQQSEK